MEIYTKAQLKNLILSNPNKRFAFYEYEPDIIEGQILITDPGSTFGATTLVSDQDPYTESMLFYYDWDLDSDYDSNQKFAVLNDEEIKGLITLLQEVLDSHEQRS